jgi:site-specific DNA recombinase
MKGSDYMRKVNKLEVKLPQLPERKKVAAYARVSSEKDHALHSLSAQISFYSSYIQKHREWQYAGVYADEGISGTTDNRAEFQRMLEDCEQGKIDIILTKSISRFARNTVDLLETVRHLKELGIEVRFEKEGINSLSEDGELMLTLLASFAQEESRSTSENVKWAIQKNFQQGRPNSFQIYGYRWDGERFVVEPEEAEVVKYIFKHYLNGVSAEKMEGQLQEKGVKSYRGGHFSASSIRAILGNEKYTGNMLLQKVYTIDHITHRQKDNNGELPRYWVEDSHEAIIDLETFEKVQSRIAKHKELQINADRSNNVLCFTSKVKCNICGANYRRIRKRLGKHPDEVWYAWVCSTGKRYGTSECSAKTIPEKALRKVCSEVLGTGEFDEDLFADRIESITVVGKDELVFHFRDGKVVSRHWKSTARTDRWTPEARVAQAAYMKKNPVSSGTVTCFTGKIRCDKCGGNLHRDTDTLASGEKTRHWRCPSNSVCGHSGLEENLLKTVSADVLGTSDFDEAVFTDNVESITVASGNELIYKLKDGRIVTRRWQPESRQPAWSEERKQRHSRIMKEAWRKKNDS